MSERERLEMQKNDSKLNRTFSLWTWLLEIHILECRSGREEYKAEDKRGRKHSALCYGIV